MTKTMMYWQIASLSIAAFILQHFIRILYSFGYHLHFYQHYPGPCKQVEGMDFGSASLHTLPDGLTLITSGFSMNMVSPSYINNYHKKGARGMIFMMNLNNTSQAPVPLKLIEETDFDSSSFRPHGISIWHDFNSGQYFVYVINHPPKDRDRVEKFILDREGESLEHVRTYKSSKFRTLYDIQALSEDSFYVTNFLYETRVRHIMVMELFSLMPWGSVVLFEPETGYQDLVTGLTSATGILTSPCGRFVYVMSCVGAEIRVYRKQNDNSLLLQQAFNLYTHPDMAVIDPISGDLFVGAHPILHLYLRHLENPNKFKSPSQVLHLRLTSGNVTSVTELLYDDGLLVSGATTGLVFNRTLLVGSIIDHLVLCHVNVPI